MKYEYTKLNSSSREIRVLLLHPARADDSGLRCDVVYLCLNDTASAPYYALSYVWGVQEPTFPISLNGREQRVGPNLFDALRCLRDRNEIAGHFLWIDALCVNQNDTEEKNSQVDIMGEIYKNAEKTLIWLGEKEHGSDLAMHLLNSVSEENLKDILANPSTTEEQSWWALRCLFQRPYWSRVWILQEVLLSTSSYLLCGSSTCPWAAVQLLLRPSNFQTMRVASHSARRAVLDRELLPKVLVEISHRRRDGTHDLLDYLVLSRQRSASVAHDHIYGVMGLVNPQVLAANYGEPVEVIYRAVVTHILRSEKSLDVLSMCCETWQHDNIHHETRLPSDASLPTWVPDWRTRFKREYQSFLLCRRPEYFAGKGESKVEFSVDGLTMRAYGVFVDTIIVVSPEEHLKRWPQVGEDWKTWTQQSGSQSIYGDLEAQRKAFGATLQCQHGLEFRTVDGSERYFDIAVGRKHGELNDAQRSYGTAGRRFFATSKGYMGRGLHCVQVGDKIVVLSGGKVPFVLRESSLKDQYRLVGECYLHGIMNGEVMSAEDIEWRHFDLI